MSARSKATLTRALGVVLALVTLVGCDHVTKYVAKAELESQPARSLVSPILGLRYVENTDMAFNLLRAVPESVRFPLLLAQGAIAITGMAVLLAGGSLQGWPRVGLLLLLAGGLGNYIDRLARGYVVDFIHVRYWPVFNVADVLITVGFGLLLLRGGARRRELGDRDVGKVGVCEILWK